MGQAAFEDLVSPEAAFLFSTENEVSTDMTVDEVATAADASTATAEEIQIAKTVAEAAAPSTKTVAEPVAPVGVEILKEVQSHLGREQGRIAQEFGQRTKALEAAIVERVDARLAPLTEELGQLRKARLAELDPEARAEFLEAENETLRTARVNGAEDRLVAGPEPAAVTDYSPAFGVVAGIARGMGLSVDITGRANEEQAKRVWAGWRDGMTQDEIVAVAEGNLRSMATAAMPTAPAKPAAPVPAKPPVSTKSAGSTPQDSYDTPTDLANALVSGVINSTESRRIRREKRESGEWT